MVVLVLGYALYELTLYFSALLPSKHLLSIAFMFICFYLNNVFNHTEFLIISSYHFSRAYFFSQRREFLSERKAEGKT